jgi:hypothetical protein
MIAGGGGHRVLARLLTALDFLLGLRAIDFIVYFVLVLVD